ncbi:hypothetical protein COV22_03010, partial [Candidatus Woesearchaeota archaeon CG10_big_fil_rev_8_21_14_0_10_47_5]
QCFGEQMCNSSSMPDPNGGSGKGCKWVHDTLFGGSWCEVSNFDTSVLTCTANSLDHCINKDNCTDAGVGGTWSADYNLCYNNEICYDGVDNDADTLVDCSDNDCYKDKACGGTVNVATGGYNTLDPLQAMKSELFKDMDPSPPAVIGNDDINTSLEATYDIMNFGIKDMGDSLGLGIMLRAQNNESVTCNKTNTSAMFYYILDSDNNATNGCNVTIKGTTYRGFEYKFIYYIRSNGTKTLNEVRQAFRCTNGSGASNWTWSMFPAKMGGFEMGVPQCPPGAFCPIPPDPRCEMGAAIIAVNKVDIANQKGNVRLIGAVSTNGSEVGLENANDSITT